jgi:hypothetical protein
MKQKNYLMKEWLKLEGRGSLLGPSELTLPSLRTPKYISIWHQVGAKKSLQVGEVGPQTFWAWVKWKVHTWKSSSSLPGKILCMPIQCLFPYQFGQIDRNLAKPWGIWPNTSIQPFFLFKVFEISNKWLLLS